MVCLGNKKQNSKRSKHRRQTGDTDPRLLAEGWPTEGFSDKWNCVGDLISTRMMAPGKVLQTAVPPTHAGRTKHESGGAGRAEALEQVK